MKTRSLHWILGLATLGMLVLAGCADEGSSSSSKNTSSQRQTDTTNDMMARGAELFAEKSSARQLSCASCHGPNGLLEGFTPEAPAFVGKDLLTSTLSGTELLEKVENMWNSESLTGHGDGNFASRSQEDRDSLLQFVLSLRTPIQEDTSSSNIAGGFDQDFPVNINLGNPGADLFSQISRARRLSCASCHGPAGNLNGFQPAPPAFLGTNLKTSQMSGSTLLQKVRQMWESENFAANGQGSFDVLPPSQQQVLLDYLVSLRQSVRPSSSDNTQNNNQDATNNTENSTSGNQQSNNNNNNNQQSSNNNNQQSSTNTTSLFGSQLFNKVSAATGRSCKSCHGPEGNLTNFTPSQNASRGTDLRRSTLTGNALRLKLEAMWDSHGFTGHGDFDVLSRRQQDSLEEYVLSLRNQNNNTNQNNQGNQNHTNTDTQEDQNTTEDNTTTDTTTEDANARGGSELYHEEGLFGVSCASCHGPDGDFHADDFDPLSPGSADLALSTLTGDALNTKVETMWNVYASHGVSSFSRLSEAEKQNLIDYTISIRTQTFASSEEAHTLCVDFNFNPFGKNSLVCRLGDSCGVNLLDSKLSTHDTQTTCLAACNEQGRNNSDYSGCDGIDN